MKTQVQIEVPGGAQKVLLHACCAPCSSAIVECLIERGIRPVIFYANSNIFPREEYDHRLNECLRYAKKWGIEIVDDVYDHSAWRQCATGLEAEPERGKRCLECFKQRLLRAAQYAAQNGFTVLTTTLASSRWKDLQQVDEAGRWACEQPGGPKTGVRAGSRNAGIKLLKKKTSTTSYSAVASSPGISRCQRQS